MHYIPVLLVGALAVTLMGFRALADAPAGPEWKLIWADEFNTPGTTAPDPAKWSYEIGYIRGQEPQYYTDSLKNVFVKDGMLNLVALKNDTYKDQTYPYTSGSINTRGKFSFQYGRAEMRAKMPSLSGAFPAFWMMGVDGTPPNKDWPNTGELDIVEFFPADSRETTTCHFIFRNSDDKIDGRQAFLHNVKPSDGFHIYAVEWSPHEMKIYFDQALVETYKESQFKIKPGTKPFENPNFLLLDMALGGMWGGKIDPHFTPQTFQIDYVRVYQHVPAATAPTTMPTTAPAPRQ